jgi:hypothetical protein
LWDRLLAEINGQLEAKNIIMTKGRINIIDATPVEAAQSGPGNGVDGLPTGDFDADWPVKNDRRGNKKFIYGFSVHAGGDEDGFIHRQSVTAGNVHDSQEPTLYCWAMKLRCTLMPRYRTRQVQDSCVKNMKYWQKRQHNQATTLL